MSVVDPQEWEEIFQPGHKRPVMSIPPRMLATSKFVNEVRAELDLDPEVAEKVADWVADKMERFGARMAQPVFDMDGNGPICSWCTTIWPLCGHHHLSLAVRDGDGGDS